MSARLGAALFAAALLGGCATASAPSPNLADERPSGREQTLVELRAEVAGIDQKQRLLSLRGEDGSVAVLPIAAEFRDFEKLRVGDVVVASYTEAVAWKVKAPSAAGSGMSARQALTNPGPGQAPGGTIEQSVTLTATITGLDAAQGTVTLTGPEGRPQVVKVRNTADLHHVQVGDMVEITFSEVRALERRSPSRPDR